MAFYQRILLATWGVFLLTAAIVLITAQFLPEGDLYRKEQHLAASLVQQVAEDLRGSLARDPATAVEQLLTRQTLDLSPILVIYVVDDQGRDILDRSVPRRVGAIARGEREHPTQGMRVATSDLGGYAVVGDNLLFPLARVLARPGGRTFMMSVALAVSALISILLARFIVLPVRRIREAGQRVADGDLSVRVAHTVGNRSDDIASLARDFDRMTERVENLLKEQQRLMRDVSHELRSPLARLLALISIARQRVEPAQAQQFDRMERELGRVDELIGSILSFAQLDGSQQLHRQPVDLVDLLENVVADASLEGQAGEKELRLQAPDQLVLPLDTGVIVRAFENVIRNAVRHSPAGAPVDVTVSHSGDQVRVVVEDRGEGVPAEALQQLFAPFFRVEEGRGTQAGSGGLGLAIAERSVRLHGGTIAAANRASGGLQVTIVLPTRD